MTTISAVYETIKDILACYNIKDFDEKSRVVRPSDEELDQAYEYVYEWWSAILSGFVVLREAVEEPTRIPDLRATSHQSLLLRPAAHIALVRALIKVVDRGLSLQNAITAANTIDWRENSDLWRNVLATGSSTGTRIVARNENYEVTSELIAHLIAPTKVPNPKALQDKIASYRGEVNYRLP
ncbi:hypothetical protein [Goodfellowiella coeruleoviolacea]|uniref:hypothetical protein n=1 Tax=Goodfellowiella coeruleoviolacea TaxID=334858 RepID=UPI0020A5B1F7|nr:hypothetical protein [Goodfellowiella coeruleoviolacea]